MKFTNKLLLILIIFLVLFGCVKTGVGPTGGMVMSDENSLSNSENTYNNLGDYKKVKAGDNISVDYVGRLQSGEIFDSSIGKNPLSFVAGAGQMIKGFDDAVIGMKVGDKKTITINPEEAYGFFDEDKVVVFDSNSFSNFDSLELGMQVSAGDGLTGIVIEKNDSNAKIDFNHRLAGKILVFEIELLTIN